jgi:hypothetical protein
MTTATPPTSAKPAHHNIRSLSPNAYVDGIYSIYNPQIGTTRGGKPYLKCLLRDASGECPARQWTFDEANFSGLDSTGFVWIAGHTLEQARDALADLPIVSRRDAVLPASLDPGTMHAPLVEHASEHCSHGGEGTRGPQLVHHVAYGGGLNLRQDGQDLGLEVGTCGRGHSAGVSTRCREMNQPVPKNPRP